MGSKTFLSLIELKKGDEIDLNESSFVFPIFIIGILSLYSDNKINIIFDSDFKNPCILYLNICSFFDHYIKINDNTFEFRDLIKDNTTYSPIIAISKAHKYDINRLIVAKLCKGLLINEIEPNYLFSRIITEIVDNSINHSHANLDLGSYYMMQIYNYEKKVSFVLVDNGIGIKQSFINNSIEFSSDIEYVKKAFELGVTSNRLIGAGNGLGGVRRMVLNTNSRLYFRSGNVLYKIYEGKESFEITDNKRQGVALELQLNISIINRDLIQNLGLEYFSNLDFEDLFI